MTAPTFSRALTVAVPVSDQDAARAVFERLGLRVGMDAELQPGFRWIELAMPAGDTTIALVPAGDGLTTGIDTGIRFATADARAAHATVTELGLDAGELLLWDTAPPMFSFTDHDGNRYYVTESAPDAG